MNAKKEQELKRKCENLAREICRKCQTFIPQIHYTEFVHDISDITMSCSDVEICWYKNRIKVTMLVGTVVCLTNSQKNAINKILRTNVLYEDVETGYAEISFNVNPHNM